MSRMDNHLLNKMHVSATFLDEPAATELRKCICEIQRLRGIIFVGGEALDRERDAIAKFDMQPPPAQPVL